MPTRKLIEVALPLDAINKASAREKSIRHGHPSTLHLWWARRPLAACRAVLFASLVDDPEQEGVPEALLAEIDRLPVPAGKRLEWDSLPIGEQRRYKLFGFIEQLVTWENSNNEQVIGTARTLIRAATNDNPPPVYDPFAGGGSIPLEAQRLGLEAHASDLNPVAVLINKALIEIPPKFANMPPVNPEDRNRIGAEWKGAAGLAADVRYYGKWMRDEAEKRIGHLYPKVQLPKEYGGGEATVIAWLWARTVKCPNPACGAQMPLARSFALSTKNGREVWVEPVVDAGSAGGSTASGRAARAPEVRFTVRYGEGNMPEGTVNRRGARCVCCDMPVLFEHVRSEGQARRLGTQMMAIVAEGKKGRVFLPSDNEHECIAANAQPDWMPDSDLPAQALGFRVQNYGITRHSDLFTPRQLVALTTFSDLINEVHEQVLRDAENVSVSYASGMQDAYVFDAYADAIATYLGLSISKAADLASTQCHWQPNPQHLKIAPTFARHALSMNWDFAEGNPFSDSSGNFWRQVELIEKVIAEIISNDQGNITQQDAAAFETHASIQTVVSTDPPYYDNVPYADLSDFFYIWLRRSLQTLYPELFGTLLVPKVQELVAEPFRHGGREAAQTFFETGLHKVFDRILIAHHPAYPLTIYYAFKQSESDPTGCWCPAQRRAGRQHSRYCFNRVGDDAGRSYPSRFLCRRNLAYTNRKTGAFT
jgi:putative DNA methylase